MIKPKRTAAEQVEDEAARRALNPTAARQKISDGQAGPEFQENHGRLKAERHQELAAMIHQDLSQIEGCPQRGLKVTIYGLNPWNSMLAFGVDSGPVPNKADLQALFDAITERSKRLYDV
jgi:hypothetical protein